MQLKQEKNTYLTLRITKVNEKKSFNILKLNVFLKKDGCFTIHVFTTINFLCSKTKPAAFYIIQNNKLI